jgi:hypothetical protein
LAIILNTLLIFSILGLLGIGALIFHYKKKNANPVLLDDHNNNKSEESIGP